MPGFSPGQSGRLFGRRGMTDPGLEAKSRTFAIRAAQKRLECRLLHRTSDSSHLGRMSGDRFYYRCLRRRSKNRARAENGGKSAPRSNGRVAANDLSGERSICVPSLRMPPASKCSGCRSQKRSTFRQLQALHQICVVIRFGEYGASETDSGYFARRPVLSHSRVTLENNGKIPPQPDRENAFAGASGGETGRLTDISPDALTSHLCISDNGIYIFKTPKPSREGS